WVLGEQSPRHLRGAAMEDVIFNGNADNGPLGMAEVSLLLERDEAELAAASDPAVDGEERADGLPPELANLSEIVVSRRYFRSGESEYAINRAPCRLKDITELFLGTGVGATPPSARWSGRGRTCCECRTSSASSSARWPRSSARRVAPRSTIASRTSSAT